VSCLFILELLSLFLFADADFFFFAGHDDRVRRRAGRLFAREHGLDWQARMAAAAGLGCCAQGLKDRVSWARCTIEKV
jgi:hypothetical protein